MADRETKEDSISKVYRRLGSETFFFRADVGITEAATGSKVVNSPSDGDDCLKEVIDKRTSSLDKKRLSNIVIFD